MRRTRFDSQLATSSRTLPIANCQLPIEKHDSLSLATRNKQLATSSTNSQLLKKNLHKNPLRSNRTGIGILGKVSWGEAIYPRLKTLISATLLLNGKQIFFHGNFLNKEPGRIGPVRGGGSTAFGSEAQARRRAAWL
jgi:hypothetical protein